MKDINKIKIIKRIDFINTEMQDLKRYENITYEDYKSDRNTQRIIERIIENIANALIDIIKIILSEFNITLPDTYREIILSLKEIEFFKKYKFCYSLRYHKDEKYISIFNILILDGS